MIPLGYCQCGCGQQTETAPETRPARGWKKGELKPFVDHHSKNKWPVSDGVTKLCRNCVTYRPVSEFYKSSRNRDRLQYTCKTCQNSIIIAHRATVNGEAIHRSARRKHRLKFFGLTPETYEAMFVAQDGRCAICNETETAIRSGRVKNLAIDHDHLTGRVRGLLCTRCNNGIGSFRDNPDILRKAIEYIMSQRLNSG